MAPRNVVLLSTGSSESESKSKHYARAAAQLGFGVRAHPDRRTAAVVACSDYRAVDAAWLCQRYGIPGPDPIAATIATHKSLAYSFLRAQGFRMLHWQVPLGGEELRDGFDRPVIVKPDRASGSFSRHPWGYRVFASTSAFHAWLVRNGQLRRFERYQAEPSSWSGRYLVMEYVASRNLYGVAALVGERHATVYDAHEMRTMPGSMVVDRILFGERHRDAPSVARMAAAFAGIGLRRSIVYLQCVERAGRLYPIDINLRPGTMFDLAVDALRLPFYDWALAAFTGRARAARFRWPHRRVGVRRIALALRR